MLVNVYFLIFFIAGISGLIYESIWSQYIKHFLGHAAYSQTLVLVIYMGGIGLGSWIVSQKSSKFKDLLSVYAIVQVLLGIAALIFHDFFIRYLDFSYESVIPNLNNSLLITIYKWFTASLIILPQSVLQGATFPLMAGGVLRRYTGLSGYKISTLYFLNSLGASLGVLWSGFFLVERYGFKGAIVTGGILDIAVGLLVFYLSKRDKRESQKPEVSSSHLPQESTPDFEIPSISTKREYYYPLLAISGLTAAASFIYEIGWIRMLSLVLGSSTHSFELMLSAFIMGLALGSFFIRNRIDKMQNGLRFLAVVQVIMGATALLTLFTYGNMFEVMRFALNAFESNEQGYFFYNLVSHFICLVLMLPTTICAGMVIPLVIHILMKKGFGEQSIGKVYAFNTFGGIIGVILAIWILMPVFGLKLLVSIGGITDILIGLYILYTFTETRNGILKTILSPVCVVVILLSLIFGQLDPVLMASGVFRYGSLPRNKKIISHRDGRTASVSLFTNSQDLVLSTNGKPDASIGLNGRYSSDEYTMAMLGVIPMAVKDQATNAAVIGLGAGMTSHYLLYDDQFENVDVIEIEPEMIRAAKKMGKRVANTFTDKRCKIYYEDAKSFFSTRNATYDIIISEPSNPWVSGVSGLFSKEFFARIKNSLNEDGILVQWFHKYECDISIVVSILKALRESFPQYELYSVSSDYLIIASDNPEADLKIKRDVFKNEALGSSLRKMGLNTLEDIKSLRFAGTKTLDPLIDNYPYPANSDYHSFVDLFAVKHRYMGTSVDEFDIIAKSVIPVRKFAEWDTTYIPIQNHNSFPNITNLSDFYNAKKIYNRLVQNHQCDSLPASITEPMIAIEHASVNPNGLSFVQLQINIFRILEQTMPFLSASEMADIWEVIGEKTATMNFTYEEDLWMDFFRALCNYDMYSINDLAILLLSQEKIADNYISRVLLASLFSSAANVGDYSAELEDIWKRYEEKDNPHFIVRLARDIFSEKAYGN